MLIDGPVNGYHFDGYQGQSEEAIKSVEISLRLAIARV